MSRQQLYINGKAVDMPKEDIKIKVESNIFSRADKIKTAHSYNVSLPRTMTNDSVFGLAYRPTSQTGGVTTHIYLDAALYVDGVPLFVGGKAVITSVNDKGYNITLLWGLIEAFDEIKAEDLELCDLPLSNHWGGDSSSDWLQLTRYPSTGWGYNSLVEDVYNEMSEEAKREVENLPWVLPVASANEIMTRIQSVYGITFDYSTLFSERLSHIWHALTTRRSMCDGELLYFTATATNFNPTSGKYFLGWQRGAQISNTYQYQNAITEYQQVTHDIYFNANLELVVQAVRVVGTSNRSFRVLFPDAQAGEKDIAATQESATRYTFDHTWKDVKVTSTLPLIDDGYGEGASTASSSNIKMYVWIEQIGDGEVGSWWSYVRNYPKLKIIDYISEILAHCGAFCVGSVTKPDSLRFVTYDEVLAASPQTLVVDGVDEIAMSLDVAPARNNIYAHNENDDDGVNYEGKGVVAVHDKTLPLEDEAFSSHFKVPRNNVVALYKIDTDDNGKKTAKWQTAGDYIGGAGAGEGGYWATFVNGGQGFDTILDNYYQGYRDIVAHPKEVEVTARVQVLRLIDIDMASPLYVKQLAANYLIESVASDNGDSYKLKLVQI